MARSREASLDEVRALYAALIAGSCRWTDSRLERAFEIVPREAFLPPGPWKLSTGEGYVETPSADPVHLYQNVLVALDAERNLNTGEPQLHAAWLAAAVPKAGETVVHLGAGAGYYSAILSLLVLPGGGVEAFEIDPALAEAARHNLAPFENVAVTCGDATDLELPEADLIYVNAGVPVPPIAWLKALRPDGRLIFPWRPTTKVGLALLVTRRTAGFTVEPLMPSWFIPCLGMENLAMQGPGLDRDAAWRTRSLRLTAQEAPDVTSIAVYHDLWFSSAPIAA